MHITGKFCLSLKVKICTLGHVKTWYLGKNCYIRMSSREDTSEEEVQLENLNVPAYTISKLELF